MKESGKTRESGDGDHEAAKDPVKSPGSVTRTSKLSAKPAVQRKVKICGATPVSNTKPPALDDSVMDSLYRGVSPVQRKQDGSDAHGDIHSHAEHGVSGSGGALPHLDTIQKSFGRHDVSDVSAHVGGRAADASRAMGAQAYATGNQVAFQQAPALHTAAHEAAHVVQQRAGVQLAGGVGRSGDRYEDHADRVADAVVRGESAESLLDTHGGARSKTAVQRKQAGSVVQRDDDPTAEGGKANFTDCEQDIYGALRDWLSASRTGASQFVHSVLAAKIESLDKGSWGSFFQTFVGGTIWSASCFAKANPAGFAVSMVGMAVQAATSIPSNSDSKANLAIVEGHLLTLLENANTFMRGQVPGKVRKFLKANPEITRYRAMAKFLEGTFKSSYHTIPKGYATMPGVAQTPVRKGMFSHATRLWDSFSSTVAKLGKGYGGPVGGMTHRLLRDTAHNKWYTISEFNLGSVTSYVGATPVLDEFVPAAKTRAGQTDGYYYEGKKFPGEGASWNVNAKVNVKSGAKTPVVTTNPKDVDPSDYGPD